jgi:hypothetical protein
MAQLEGFFTMSDMSLKFKKLIASFLPWASSQRLPANIHRSKACFPGVRKLQLHVSFAKERGIPPLTPISFANVAV